MALRPVGTQRASRTAPPVRTTASAARAVPDDHAQAAREASRAAPLVPSTAVARRRATHVEGAAAAGVAALSTVPRTPRTPRTVAEVIEALGTKESLSLDAMVSLFDALLTSTSPIDGEALEAALKNRNHAFASAYAQTLDASTDAVKLARLFTRIVPPAPAMAPVARALESWAEIEPGVYSREDFAELEAGARAAGVDEQLFVGLGLRGVSSDVALEVGLGAFHDAPKQACSLARGLLAHGAALAGASPALRTTLASALRDHCGEVTWPVQRQLSAAHPLLGRFAGAVVRRFIEADDDLQILCALFEGSPESLRAAFARLDDKAPGALAQAVARLGPVQQNVLAALRGSEPDSAPLIFRALKDIARLPAAVAALRAGDGGASLGISSTSLDVVEALAGKLPQGEDVALLRRLGADLLTTPTHALGGALLHLMSVAREAGWEVPLPTTPAQATSSSSSSSMDVVLPRIQELREARELASQMLQGLPHEAILNGERDLGVELHGVERLSARPELQLLATVALVDAHLSARDLSAASHAARMRDVEHAIGAWRTTHLGAAPATSKRARMREAAVGAAAMPFAILEAVLSAPEVVRCGSDVLSMPGTSGLDLAPAVFALVGERDTAVNADRRRPVLLALASLATVGLRTLEDTGVRAELRAVLESAAGEKHPLAFAERCRALAHDLEQRFPSPGPRIEAARARAASGLQDAPGASGVLRAVSRWAAAFTEGVEAAALERLLQSLEHGTLDEVRRQSLVASRFPVSAAHAARLPRIFDQLHAGDSANADALLGRPSTQGLASAVDEGGAHAWARAVDDVQSCQSTDRSASTNQGLLNRFEDGSVRLLAVRDDDGVTVARAAMRLVTLPDTARPALLVDRHYTAFSAAEHEVEAHAMLAALARRRGEALGLPVLFADPRAEPTGGMVRHATVGLPAPRAPDYVDLDGTGVVPGGKAVPPIAASVVVVEPRRAS